MAPDYPMGFRSFFVGRVKAAPVPLLEETLGEFLVYTLRLASGHLTDRLGRCWPIVFAV